MRVVRKRETTTLKGIPPEETAVALGTVPEKQ